VFWAEIADQVGDDATLREVIALVGTLCTRLFAAPLPAPISAWIREIRSGVKVWIDILPRPGSSDATILADLICYLLPSSFYFSNSNTFLLEEMLFPAVWSARRVCPGC
jgi:hypothetical protein